MGDEDGKLEKEAEKEDATENTEAGKEGEEEGKEADDERKGEAGPSMAGKKLLERANGVQPFTMIATTTSRTIRITRTTT